MFQSNSARIRPHPSRRAARGLAPLLLAGNLIATSLSAAGLPFFEDFSDSTNIDFAHSNANVDTANGAVTLPERLTWVDVPYHNDNNLNNVGNVIDFVFVEQGVPVAALLASINSAAIADLNHDGRLDLVLTTNGFNWACLDDGELDFRDELDNTICNVLDDPIRTSENTGKAVIVDLNRDGNPDVVLANSSTTKVHLGNGDGTFGAAIGLGDGPQQSRSSSMAFADLNRDGHLDVVLGYASRNQVYLGNGDGSFATPAAQVWDENPPTTDVALADLDGDGNIDLYAAANGQDYWYPGNGDGSFGNGIAVGEAGDASTTVEIGDVDGNGTLDVITNVSVHFNDGAGNFTTVDQNLAALTLLLADIDRDGDLDLYAAGSGNRPSFFLNDGSGIFGGRRNLDYSLSANSVSAIAIADFDRDGILDLFSGIGINLESKIYFGRQGGVFDYTGRRLIPNAPYLTSDIHLFDQDGDDDLDVLETVQSEQDRYYTSSGSVGYSGPFFLGNSATPAAAATAVGDLNGDNEIDKVTVGYNSQVATINLGNVGTEGFGAATSTGYASGLAQLDVALADVDEDGDLDILVPNFNGDPTNLYVNPGDGVFGEALEVGGDSHDSRSIATGDVDGDGHVDMAVGNAGLNRIYLGDGTGGFGDSGAAIGTRGGTTSAIELADLNHDGHLDAVAVNDGAANYYHLGDGAGGFSDGTRYGNTSEQTTAVQVRDFNGDARRDILEMNTGIGIPRLFLSRPDYSFPTDGGIPVGEGVEFLDRNPNSVAVGDIDDDGDPDIIIGHYNELDRIHRNDQASGGFDVFGEDIGNSAREDRGLVVGDVDRDGLVDLITLIDGGRNRFYPGDAVERFSGNGDSIGSESDNSRAGLLADLDHDGHLDLVVANHGQPNRLYLGDGSGGFGPASNISELARASTGVAIGDVNHDGAADLVFTNSGENNTLHLGNGDGSFQAGTAIGSEVDDSRGLVLADFNRDGYLDVAVANYGATNKVYFGDGLGGFDASGTAVGSETDNSTAVAAGDLDTDANLDLAFANDGQTSKLYLGDGAGNFDATGTDIGMQTGSATSILLFDIGNDGDLDLVLGLQGDVNRYYYNDGDAALSMHGLPMDSVATATAGLAAHDVDRDGDFDLVEANAGGVNRFYRQTSYRPHLGEVTSGNILDGEIGVSMLRLTPQTSSDADIDWFLSNDGGAKWHRVRPGVDFTFPDTGNNDVRWKARLKSYSHVLTPRLLAVEIDGDYVSLGVINDAIRSIRKLEKNKSVKRHKKTKKALRNARKHLGKALQGFEADDFESGQAEIGNAIADLEKVKKRKSNAKKLIARLEAST